MEKTFCYAFSFSAFQCYKLPTTMLLISGLHTHSAKAINVPHVDSREWQCHEVPFRIIKEKQNHAPYSLRAILPVVQNISTGMCWTRLLLVCESLWLNTKEWCGPDGAPPKLGHSRSIYTMGTDICWKSGHFFFFFYPQRTGLLTHGCLYLWNCIIQ